ncbi:MAG TPA: NYN domain-containing protein [Pirellulales bacterium]|jgi:hypothetical protein|nr:NYN domain-containing protein [Pirellulales bacterium]
MRLLIDGYNLMHAGGIAGRVRGAKGLEHSRLALLNFVAEAIEQQERATATVVFDAAGAPPGLPDVLEHRGLCVRFAKGYPSADDLLEELIQHESAPRQLTVVSSDHRVQRAARRRRATAVDSEVWYDEARRRRAALARPQPLPRERPAAATSDDVEYWLRQFDEPVPADDTAKERPVAGESIFPPGYAEDLDEDGNDRPRKP